MKRSLFTLIAVVLVAAPVAAMDRVPPGVDLFATRGNGETFMDFSSNPIPAGFFCPGSTPFTGRVEFRGLPIAGAPGNTDTIIERLDEAELNERGIGSTRIRVRAVQLESLTPLSTSCGEFVLRAYLSPREQPLTRMRIHQTEGDGGFFTAALALNLRLVFSPVSGRGRVRELDDTVSFGRSTRLPWAAAVADAPATGLTVDVDGDGRPETRLTRSLAFVAGHAPGIAPRDGGGLLGAPQALAASSDVAQVPISHLDLQHAHYVDPCDICVIQDVE